MAGTELGMRLGVGLDLEERRENDAVTGDTPSTKVLIPLVMLVKRKEKGKRILSALFGSP